MAKRLSKKVAKLEKKAGALRHKAEKKGKRLDSATSDRIEDLAADEKGGGKGFFALLLAAGAGIAAVMMKKKRDQELDEALWEEPRSM